MDEKTTGELLKTLQSADSLEELRAYRQEYTSDRQKLSFANAFSGLLETRRLSRAEVIRRSMLDRTYAYQILGGMRAPGRDKVIALGIAAGASLKEIQHLLTCAMEGPLYPRFSRDTVLIYCIEHGYDVLRTNEMLEDAGEDLLL